jgi:hypothetical protein
MKTITNCSNCNKELKKGEKEYCEKANTTECAECQYHEMNGTRSIEKFNTWLKKP